MLSLQKKKQYFIILHHEHALLIMVQATLWSGLIFYIALFTIHYVDVYDGCCLIL